MAQCPVSGCVADTERRYSGIVMCMTPFSGDPETHRFSLRGCLLGRGADMQSRDDDLASLRAEIERLTVDNAELQRKRDGDTGLAAAASKEIARLSQAYADMDQTYRIRVSDLQVENERMRAALARTPILPIKASRRFLEQDELQAWATGIEDYQNTLAEFAKAALSPHPRSAEHETQ
jgi:hypothetical protein